MNLVTPLRTALLCLSILVLPASTSAQDQDATTQPDTANQADNPEITTTGEMPALPVASKEDVSFSLGYKIGTDMAKGGVEIDLDADEFASGIRAGLGLDEARLTPEQIAMSMYSFQMQMQQKFIAKAQENLDRGIAYLEQNAEQEGVTVTESGLQYRVIESGEGATPTLDDMVAARYRGTFIDGTEFDSSPGDEAVPFPVARVIPGWIEALQLMKVGDKWELVVPVALAYGEAGTPDGKIGPNEVLIFEIDLVEIK